MTIEEQIFWRIMHKRKPSLYLMYMVNRGSKVWEALTYYYYNGYYDLYRYYRNTGIVIKHESFAQDKSIILLKEHYKACQRREKAHRRIHLRNLEQVVFKTNN